MLSKLKKKYNSWMKRKELEKIKYKTMQKIISSQLMTIETLCLSLEKANETIEDLESKVAAKKVSKTRKKKK